MDPRSPRLPPPPPWPFSLFQLMGGDKSVINSSYSQEKDLDATPGKMQTVNQKINEFN